MIILGTSSLFLIPYLSVNLRSGTHGCRELRNWNVRLIFITWMDISLWGVHTKIIASCQCVTIFFGHTNLPCILLSLWVGRISPPLKFELLRIHARGRDYVLDWLNNLDWIKKHLPNIFEWSSQWIWSWEICHHLITFWDPFRTCLFHLVCLRLTGYFTHDESIIFVIFHSHDFYDIPCFTFDFC